MKKALMILVTLLTIIIGTTQTVEANELDYEYKNFVKASAEQAGVDEYIVLGLIEKESGNNIDAVNSDGTCYGPCQIHRCWNKQAQELGLDIMNNPYDNISFCCHMLSSYYQQYGDYNKTLVHYNAGHLYADSSSYSRDIIKRADRIREQEMLPY